MSISHLRHILETKGPLHGVERLAQIIWRFAAGRQRLDRMIQILEDDFSQHDVRVTFCVTASLLKRHKNRIQRLRAQGHEIAAHGYFHTRMDRYDLSQQSKILNQSYQAFAESGFPISGFRCPYLNFNEDTRTALRSSPYAWTSQHFVFWKNGFGPGANLERLQRLYHIAPASEALSLPTINSSIVEIPITAPDDEMLVERYRIRDQEQMSRIWLNLMEQSFLRGELLHLMFHPERFDFVHRALLRVVQEVKKTQPPVWTPTLGELTTWWQERDAARWEIEETEHGLRAWIQPPPKGTILVNGQGAGKTSGQKSLNGYVPATPLHQDQRGLCFDAGDGVRSTVGISERSSRALEEFLRTEGFLIERSDNPESHSFFVDHPGEFKEANERPLLGKLADCRQPLLRLWRWPDSARAAFALSSDVDSISLADFLDRTLHF